MQKDFEKILAIASEFSTRKSPAMTYRESVLGHALTELKSVVDSLNNPVPLGVQKGGSQGNFAPVPWLRVYSPDHSRNATAGFFLAYFFASDGSCVCLSLNEGTAELRSGQWHPINDASRLKQRATAGRGRLPNQEQDDTLRRATTVMDLRPDAVVGVSERSRRRIRNYQAANLYAFRYARGAVPEDAVLEADLTAMLPHLLSLY